MSLYYVDRPNLNAQQNNQEINNLKLLREQSPACHKAVLLVVLNLTWVNFRELELISFELTRRS